MARPGIQGLKRLQKTLNRLARKHGTGGSVIVGFTQAYALPVHENMEAKHNVGQAKYLEQPARELSNSGELGRIVIRGVKGGATLVQSIVVAGLRLQRESQKLVPVDTGALKISAFTRKE